VAAVLTRQVVERIQAAWPNLRALKSRELDSVFRLIESRLHIRRRAPAGVVT
jgi:hypothetical protein